MNFHVTEQVSVLILIPCYNEEQNIRNMISQLYNAQKKIDTRFHVVPDILIVNDGSTDKTKIILERMQNDYNFFIIQHPTNLGYGKTLRTGFTFAMEKGYQWVISFDMDGQHEPRCLYRFMDQIMRIDDNIALISGTRYKNADYFWQNPWKDRYLVNCIISIALAKFHIHVTDAFCGMKAFQVDFLREFPLTTDGYEMPLEYWMKIQQHNQKFIELAVPLIYKNRLQVFKRDIPEVDLIHNACDRLRHYITIINQYTQNPLDVNFPALKNLFRKYYDSYHEINQANFQMIWTQLENDLATIIRRVEPIGETRCTYCRCSSGRC